MANEFEQLNVDCTCITLDRDKLCNALNDLVGDATFCQGLAATHSNLVSTQPLFLTDDHARQMQGIIDAIERVAGMPQYDRAVLAHAPAIAGFSPGAVGVFMGYDFHLGRQGPQLIEINTNAGGALVNAYVRQAQLICCGEMAVAAASRQQSEEVLAAFLGSFRSEWGLQRKSGPLRSIAIVDQAPQTQYLYPEFVLFQRLFERHGMRALIADPAGLVHRDGALWIDGERIDLVYNRLTDFDLSQAASATLRAAYLAGDVVVTPNPWAHARFADKRNLALLSDEARLREWGVAADDIATLVAGIPRTVVVTAENADALWSGRRDLFFKPCSGYGSKAAYRGDKVTRKVWGDILGASYVAQQIVPPSTRSIAIDGRVESLKADLRCYTYAGRLLLPAARLYQGQTTNFRTPGGGFAPVIIGTGAAACLC